MPEVTLTSGFEDLVIEVVDSNGESICSFEGENLKLILEASVKSFFDSVIEGIPEPYDLERELARSDESQMATLRAIRDLTAEYGYAPSVRDVCKAIGRSSSSTAQRIIDYLKKRGLIEYKPKIARSMKVTDKGLKILEAYDDY
jgi:hypothetical protein